MFNKNYTKPMYQSYSSIILSATDGAIDNSDQSITSSDIAMNEKLVNSYAEVIKSKETLNKVIDNLNLNISETNLNQNISVITDTKTTVIKINVKSENPEEAVAISENLIDVFFTRIKELYNVKTASILDHPVANKAPVNINPTKFLIYGACIGLVVSITLIVMMDALNEKVRSESDLEKKAKLSVLANIPRYKERAGIVALNQQNIKNESFRVLVANIKYLQKKTILITSNIPGVGKSFVSSNLALTYAGSSMRTLLIDSDLRRGVQHKLFEIPNKKGLADLIRDNSTDYKKYITPSVVENLDILTRGSNKLNYSKLLFSNVIGQIVEQAKNDYDFIVVDGTPNELVADDTLLFSKVDATIIVAKYNVTKFSSVRKLKKTIKTQGGNALGVVINNIPGKYLGEKKYNYYGERTSMIMKEKPGPARH
ncbi:MAG: polysaccharide biosynthesis tyrosine autokinase [Clostridia bacterium]|nr:polysaccharide biosynthesis tyrosine autokinase [Clostridia bacterium]